MVAFRDFVVFHSLLLILICSYPIKVLFLFFIYLLVRRYIAYYGIFKNGEDYNLDKNDYKIFKKYKNFLIIGSQACGKSSLAKRLKARYCDLELVEFDNLYWGKNWKRNNTKFYRAVKTRLFDKIPADTPKGYDYKPKYENGVIMDGNFNIIKELTWNLADIVIWLDYDFDEVFYRAIKRVFIRIITKKKVCNGNLLTLKRLWYNWKTCVIYKIWNGHHKINTETIPNDFIKVFPNKKVIRLKSPYQCEQWLRQLQ